MYMLLLLFAPQNLSTRVDKYNPAGCGFKRRIVYLRSSVSVWIYMPKNPSRSPELPACYAQVVPGLESIAAEEIASELEAEIRKKAEGVVIFRVPEISSRLLD